MTAEKIDSAAVLAFLEAKIAALQAVANSWKKALELGALGPIRFPRTAGDTVTETDSQPTEGPVELPSGSFSKLSVSDAIKLYLSAIKKKQTNKQIEAALKEGGLESTAKNFSSIVNGALKRLKDNDILLRFKEGWGLAENYPDHLRAKIAQHTKQKKATKGRKKKSKGDASAAEKQGVPQPEGLEHRIEGVLKADPSKTYLPHEAAEILHIDRPGLVATALGRMASKHKAEKVAGGKYRAFSGTKVQEMPKAVKV